MSARGLVAVTGAEGFAGTALCAHLRAAAIPVRALVRTLAPDAVAQADTRAVGDLVAIADTALADALRGAEVVVHLAGRAHVMRETAADPLAEFRAINVAATERLARAAAGAAVAHFVFASSVKVNGESTSPGESFSESDPPAPRDDYALSKWEAERVLREVARDTGMPVTILRLPLLYGPGVKGNVARLTDWIARGIPLPLASIDNRRSMLGAGNLVSALDALLSGPRPAPHGAATYLLADPVAVSTPELVRAIAAALGAKPRLVAFPEQVLHLAAACVGQAPAVDRLTSSLVVDPRAFCAAFDWHAPRTLAEELADMVRARRDRSDL